MLIIIIYNTFCFHISVKRNLFVNCFGLYQSSRHLPDKSDTQITAQSSFKNLFPVIERIPTYFNKPDHGT